jgi:hypothetical protein
MVNPEFLHPQHAKTHDCDVVDILFLVRLVRFSDRNVCRYSPQTGGVAGMQLKSSTANSR